MADRPIIFSAEAERFDALVIPEPNSGCWLWLGTLNAKGYGRFHTGEMAHRVAMRLACVEIPDGMEPDHTCRVRCCVNPDHLEPVTHRENLLRGNTIVARAARATHCPQGHPYAGRNLVVRQGKRGCRECQRLRALAQYTPTTNRRRRPHLMREEVADIRSRIASGDSHSKISRALGISMSTISNVRNGRESYGR